MDVNYLIKLTLALYKTTETWGETNFLKSQIRNLANEILVDFILVLPKSRDLSSKSSNLASESEDSPLKKPDLSTDFYFLENIRKLQQGLVQARNQKLIDRNNFSLLKQEYDGIRQERIKIKQKQKIRKKKRIKQSKAKKVLKKKKNPGILASFNDLNQRQTKILGILSHKQKIQVWELKNSFSEVSKRTLRRDLEELLKKGLVKRAGEWNQVSYALAANKTMG